MRYLLPIFIVVISNPYRDINYNKVNVYNIKKKYRKEIMTTRNHKGIVYKNKHYQEKSNDVFIPWLFTNRRNRY